MDIKIIIGFIVVIIILLAIIIEQVIVSRKGDTPEFIGFSRGKSYHNTFYLQMFAGDPDLENYLHSEMDVMIFTNYRIESVPPQGHDPMDHNVHWEEYGTGNLSGWMFVWGNYDHNIYVANNNSYNLKKNVTITKQTSFVEIKAGKQVIYIADAEVDASVVYKILENLDIDLSEAIIFGYESKILPESWMPYMADYYEPGGATNLHSSIIMQYKDVSVNSARRKVLEKHLKYKAK